MAGAVIQKHDKGKKPAVGKPSASRRMFVPSPEEHHHEYVVYSDCQDRLNDRHKEYQPSLILVQAQLDDRCPDVLELKSSLRRRYDTIGQEEMDKSDYIPTLPRFPSDRQGWEPLGGRTTSIDRPKRMTDKRRALAGYCGFRRPDIEDFDVGRILVDTTAWLTCFSLMPLTPSR